MGQDRKTGHGLPRGLLDGTVAVLLSEGVPGRQLGSRPAFGDALLQLAPTLAAQAAGELKQAESRGIQRSVSSTYLSQVSEALHLVGRLQHAGAWQGELQQLQLHQVLLQLAPVPGSVTHSWFQEASRELYVPALRLLLRACSSWEQPPAGEVEALELALLPCVQVGHRAQHTCRAPAAARPPAADSPCRWTSTHAAGCAWHAARSLLRALLASGWTSRGRLVLRTWQSACCRRAWQQCRTWARQRCGWCWTRWCCWSGRQVSAPHAALHGLHPRLSCPLPRRLGRSHGRQPGSSAPRTLLAAPQGQQGTCASWRTARVRALPGAGRC